MTEIRLGSHGELVERWQATMLIRFRSYALASNGGPLKIDGYYGYDDQAVQREYQRRIGAPQDGIVHQGDLEALKLVPAHKGWLFTVQGTAVPDPFGPGLPADTARDCLDLYNWQPIGNYPARAFPMWGSIMDGYNELTSQIRQKPGRINAAGYSQGAVVVSLVLKHEIMDPKGSLHHRLHDVRKIVLWGNPCRQKDFAHFDHWIHPIAGPGSGGILADERLYDLESQPFQVRDYAHDGDMYATNYDNDRDEYKRAIAKIIMRATDWFGGEDSVFSQLKELGMRPLEEGIAMAKAIIDAGRFFTNTAHGYNRYPALDWLREP